MQENHRRTCLTLRVDITDFILPTILTYFKKDPRFQNVLIYHEHRPKNHLHIRYASDLTRQTMYANWKLTADNLGLNKTQHAHHVVWETLKGKRNPCKKHKNCPLGSMTYIAKCKNLLYRHGHTQASVDHIEHIGCEILANSRLPLSDKIIELGDLKSHSPPERILSAIKEYYSLTDKVIKQTRPMSRLIHEIKLKIDWYDYKQKYYSAILWAISEKDPIFNF